MSEDRVLIENRTPNPGDKWWEVAKGSPGNINASIPMGLVDAQYSAYSDLETTFVEILWEEGDGVIHSIRRTIPKEIADDESIQKILPFLSKGAQMAASIRMMNGGISRKVVGERFGWSESMDLFRDYEAIEKMKTDEIG